MPRAPLDRQVSSRARQGQSESSFCVPGPSRIRPAAGQPIGGFVFWQNMPTHLQSAWIAELAARVSVEVRIAIQSDIPDWRRGMGWSFPDYGAARVDIGLEKQEVIRIIDAAGPSAVHTFSGLGAYTGVDTAF